MSTNMRVLTGLEILEEAERLNELADKAIESGDYQTAEKLSQRALCIKESELGSNHPAVAVDLFNVALLCQAVGNYAEAFAFLRRALVIEQTCLGSQHSTVQETQNALSELLDQMEENAYLESPYAAQFVMQGA